MRTALNLIVECAYASDLIVECVVRSDSDSECVRLRLNLIVECALRFRFDHRVCVTLRFDVECAYA